MDSHNKVRSSSAQQSEGRKRAPTVVDVARLAGVGASTASRALAGRGYVSEETHQRVRRAADALGYVPNGIARSLKARSTDVVGLLVDDLASEFWTFLSGGIEVVLRAKGYGLLLAASGGDADLEASALERFFALRVAGVIMTPATSRSAALILAFARQGLTIVEVDRQSTNGACDAVLLDNEEAGYLAARHLLELGHRRIGLLVGPFSSGEGRVAGFQRAHLEVGGPLEPRRVSTASFHPDDPPATARAFLDQNQDVTAVVAANNILAGGMLAALRDRSLSVPDDMSLIGFDAVSWMSFVHPPLTTVAQPAREIGMAAAEVLLDRIEGRLTGPAQTRLMKSSLLVRGSTSSPRGSSSAPSAARTRKQP